MRNINNFLKQINYFAYLFMVLAAIQGFALVNMLPPFQGADEDTHTLRANSISLGYFFSQNTPTGQPGGPVDRSIGLISDSFRYLKFQPNIRVNEATLDTASKVQWVGVDTLTPYPSAALSSSIFYIPSAIGITAGRTLGWGPLASIEIGRLFNALSYLVLGFTSLAIAGSAAPPLFVVLILPMSVSLGSYITQDGLINASLALAVALLIRTYRATAHSNRPIITAVLILLAISTAKSPYILLLVPLLFISRWRNRTTIWVVTAAILAGASWHIIGSKLLPVVWPIDPSQQMGMLLASPIKILSIARTTMDTYALTYLLQLVGFLGWLDAPVPMWFVYLTVVTFSVSVWCMIYDAPYKLRIVPKTFLIVAVTCLAGSVGMIFGALYLVWTPLGASVVEGVQGRYFIPLILYIVFVLAPISFTPPPKDRMMDLAITRLGFTVYGVISTLVTMATVFHRYYGTVFW